jgi:Zn-dependent protease with chaperone function
MQFVYLLLEFAAAFALTALLNAIALRGWRRAGAAHWSERARELWPAKVGQAYNLLVVPLGVVALFRWAAPQAPGHWFHDFLATLLGTKFGSWFMPKEIIPWVTWRMLLNEFLFGWAFFALRITLYGLAIFQLAEGIDALGLGLAAGVMLYDLWTARGGLMRLMLWAGMYRVAPPALDRLVVEVCARMQVPRPAVWVTESSQCNAFALVLGNALLFTQVLIDELPEEELKSVIAHELAHLTESRTARYGRLAGLLGWWPWLFLGPLVQRFGSFIIVALVWWWVLLSKLLRRFSQRMEVRADAQAVAQEAEAAPVYARALARLHELNQVPAVLAGKGTTHPHLYDRLQAAGIQPDFPRPAAPLHANPFCTVVYVALFILFVTQIPLFADVMRLLGTRR